MNNMHLVGLLALSTFAHAQSLPPMWDGPPPATLEEALNWPSKVSQPAPTPAPVQVQVNRKPATVPEPTQTPTAETTAPVTGTLYSYDKVGNLENEIRLTEEVATGNRILSLGYDSKGHEKTKLISAARYKEIQDSLSQTGRQRNRELIGVALRGNPLKAIQRVKSRMDELHEEQYAVFTGNLTSETRVQPTSFSRLSDDAKGCLSQQADEIDDLTEGITHDPRTHRKVKTSSKFLLSSLNVTRIQTDFRVTEKSSDSKSCEIRIARDGDQVKIYLTGSIRSDLSILSCRSCKSRQILDKLQDFSDYEDAAKGARAERATPKDTNGSDASGGALIYDIGPGGRPSH